MTPPLPAAVQRTRMVILPSTLLPGTSVENEAELSSVSAKVSAGAHALQFGGTFGDQRSGREDGAAGDGRLGRPIGRRRLDVERRTRRCPHWSAICRSTCTPSTERGAIFAAVTAFFAISEAWTAFVMSAEPCSCRAGRSRCRRARSRKARCIRPRSWRRWSLTAPGKRTTPPDGSEGQQPSWRAITICCTSSVPSPMVRILASR